MLRLKFIKLNPEVENIPDKAEFLAVKIDCRVLIFKFFEIWNSLASKWAANI